MFLGNNSNNDDILLLHDTSPQESKHGYDKLFENRAQESAWAVECLDLLANFLVAENETKSGWNPCRVELKMT